MKISFGSNDQRLMLILVLYKSVICTVTPVNFQILLTEKSQISYLRQALLVSSLPSPSRKDHLCVFVYLIITGVFFFFFAQDDDSTGAPEETI